MTDYRLPDDKAAAGMLRSAGPSTDTWADLSLPDKLRMLACAAGEPWTCDDPASDHGHTDCWLLHQAADEIERLRAVVRGAVSLAALRGEGRLR